MSLSGSVQGVLVPPPVALCCMLMVHAAWPKPAVRCKPQPGPPGPPGPVSQGRERGTDPARYTLYLVPAQAECGLHCLEAKVRTYPVRVSCPWAHSHARAHTHTHTHTHTHNRWTPPHTVEPNHPATTMYWAGRFLACPPPCSCHCCSGGTPTAPTVPRVCDLTKFARFRLSAVSFISAFWTLLCTLARLFPDRSLRIGHADPERI